VIRGRLHEDTWRPLPDELLGWRLVVALHCKPLHREIFEVLPELFETCVGGSFDNVGDNLDNRLCK
jgi:hypothetical protein